MTLLLAYFDESHIGDDPVTTIGGFVATKKNWESVESAWRALLAELDVPNLHNCEMRAQKGMFSRFEQWKIEYAETHCRIIERNDIVPVYASIHRRDWDSMSGRDWEEFIGRYPNPYYLAFEHVIQRSQFYVHLFDEDLAIVFSEQNQFMTRANDIYAGYENSPANKHLAPLTFANMRRVTPLQCADVIASEINEYWERVEGKPDDVGDWILNRPLGSRLAKKNNLQHGGLYGRDALKYAARKYVACGRIYPVVESIKSSDLVFLCRRREIALSNSSPVSSIPQSNGCLAARARGIGNRFAARIEGVLLARACFFVCSFLRCSARSQCPCPRHL